jgi:hypothetical protein
MVTYPGTYADKHGLEIIAVRNDGETLRTEVRGVQFVGDDFDALTPVAETPRTRLASFTLNRGALCACRLSVEIQIPLVLHSAEVEGSLCVELELGSPAPNGGIDREVLRLEVAYAGSRIASSGLSGWFEDELLDLRHRLPTGVSIKACFNCLYSDYSPYGHGLFGGMLCFRNIKAEYLRVKSKHDFWAVHGREDRQVQETYLCQEFTLRVPGTGYRG